MAVTYFYPAPEINVGKPFLGEYLTSFLNQRKDDHKLMIARKLKALDPSRLITLEQSHVRNIGRLQEQLFRIEREDRSAKGRLEVARMRAEGSVKSQLVAASGSRSKDTADLKGRIISEALETYRDTQKSQPSDSEIKTLRNGVRSDKPAQYLSNLRAVLTRNPDDRVKREWLVLEAYRLARQNGHTGAADAIKNNFGSDAPNINETDPWKSFVEDNPGVEGPEALADRLIKKHAGRAKTSDKNAIRTQIFKAVAPEPAKAGGGPIGYLQGILDKEVGELEQVRGERREMQAAYKKTAFDSYMTPWLAPSYTKAPEWQQDLEIMGDMGAKRPTRFSHFMETATDVYMEPSVAGLGVLRQQDPTEVENRYRALETEPGGPDYGGQPALVGPSESAPFVSPGNQDAVDKLGRMVNYYQAEMRAGDTKGAAKQLFDMYALLKANPDQYGETGASIVRSIDAAHKTGNYGNLYNEVVGAAKQGQASVGRQREVARAEAASIYTPQPLKPEGSTRSILNADDITQVDIDELKAMDTTALVSWAKKAQADLRGYESEGTSSGREERLKALLTYAVVGNNSLLNLSKAKGKLKEAKDAFDAMPVIEQSERDSIALAYKKATGTKSGDDLVNAQKAFVRKNKKYFDKIKAQKKADADLRGLKESIAAMEKSDPGLKGLIPAPEVSVLDEAEANVQALTDQSAITTKMGAGGLEPDATREPREDAERIRDELLLLEALEDEPASGPVRGAVEPTYEPYQALPSAVPTATVPSSRAGPKPAFSREGLQHGREWLLEPDDIDDEQE